MTDARTCMVLSGRPGAPLAVVQGGELIFSVSGSKYPGRERVALRVDGGEVRSGDPFVRGDDAIALLSELRNGLTVATQYVNWPSGAKRDETFEVCGFVPIVDECMAEQP